MKKSELRQIIREEIQQQLNDTKSEAKNIVKAVISVYKGQISLDDEKISHGQYQIWFAPRGRLADILSDGGPKTKQIAKKIQQAVDKISNDWKIGFVKSKFGNHSIAAVKDVK